MGIVKSICTLVSRVYRGETRVAGAYCNKCSGQEKCGQDCDDFHDLAVLLCAFGNSFLFFEHFGMVVRSIEVKKLSGVIPLVFYLTEQI